MSADTATDAPKPHLARILEAVAAIMGLDDGQHRLELLFDNGRLTKFFAHGGPCGATSLADYDDQAAWLVSRAASTEPAP